MDGLINTFRSQVGQIRSELAAAWNDGRPIIKMLRTKSNQYLYDTGTNRIYLCSPIEYQLIENLANKSLRDALDIRQYTCTPDEFVTSLKHINDLMNENNILKATRIRLREPNQIDASIHNSLGQIILETTERCNLRCRYCVYDKSFNQKRNHGHRDMSLDIAYRAIDHLANSSSMKERVAISFYGGEPLLRFPFIRECVLYAKKRITENKLIFSLTTNGTLMTRKMAAFFSNSGFGVHVSIDGPQEIHNKNRIYPNHRGSYLNTKRAMKYLVDTYSEENIERISMSMVYSLPYSTEKMGRIAALWDEPWLPKNIGFSFSYCQNSFAPSQWKSLGIDYSAINWAIEKYLEAYRLGLKPHPLAAQFLDKKLAMIHQRNIYNKQIQEAALNACCLPATRKIFFSVDGTMYLCERIGSAPEIGNISNGLDIDKAKRIYISEYRIKSEARCSSCWCSRLCDICYVQSYYNGKYDSHYRDYHCDMQKTISEIYLKLYCLLIEINPGGIDRLLDMQIY